MQIQKGIFVKKLLVTDISRCGRSSERSTVGKPVNKAQKTNMTVLASEECSAH